MSIHIVGGGLAGSEAAWQAASMGVRVTIHEMRGVRPTAVHKTDGLAELVCSNSFRGDKLDNAVGLLKEEMRRLGSLIMREADRARVPAGAALAVDRDAFSQGVTAAITAHPLITVVREEVPRIPADPSMYPLVIATGPLTSDALSADIVALVGAEHLAFYDAISPIIHADSIDMNRVFRASRWGRSLGGNATAGRDPSADPAEPVGRDQSAGPAGHVGRDQSAGPAGHVGRDQSAGPAGAVAQNPSAGPAGPANPADPAAEGDYLNCPMTREEYDRFYDALVQAESATVHDFDNTKFFEGCLPIEVMAHRGRDTLRFGPMKPVGLVDPKTGRSPYAVVQLRQDNLAADHWSIVGFQTQIKWGEQARVLRMIPGLEQAEFVRLGMVHRNTYINGPTVLRDTWQTKARPDLFFAGQISGVEGYVESAASGLIAGRNAALVSRGEEPRVPPRTTAIGALAYYVSHADPNHYQPTNITFGIIPFDAGQGEPRSAAGRKLKGADRKQVISDRALKALDEWMAAQPVAGRL